MVLDLKVMSIKAMIRIEPHTGTLGFLDATCPGVILKRTGWSIYSPNTQEDISCTSPRSFAILKIRTYERSLQ
jgi:hypothetical protein